MRSRHRAGAIVLRAGVIFTIAVAPAQPSAGAAAPASPTLVGGRDVPARSANPRPGGAVGAASDLLRIRACDGPWTPCPRVTGRLGASALSLDTGLGRARGRDHQGDGPRGLPATTLARSSAQPRRPGINLKAARGCTRRLSSPHARSARRPARPNRRRATRGPSAAAPWPAVLEARTCVARSCSSIAPRSSPAASR
jgi:hypothetical protein